MGVVVAFDVTGDFNTGIAGVLEASLLEHLDFERVDEGFGPGVFAGIGAGGHALPKARRGQSLAEGRAAVLAAAIAVIPSLKNNLTKARSERFDLG